MKRLIYALALMAGTFLSVQGQNKNAFAVQTKTHAGTIEGQYDTKSGIQTYFGVPFAEPPVGELRWKAPQPLKPWSGIKETKAFGPRPMQKLVYGDMNSRSNGVSEDCLYLNVWTPASRNTKDLPVLVYFYGGGNVAGDGSEPRYDGEAMAKKGMVVVTTNYRLNIFGYFAHPELSAESSYKASGNYGYLDQVAALKWVQQNIAQFGGDPKKVTIAGESAGSISVSYQMASPLAKGLIAGAIGESGAGIYPTLPPVALADAEKIGTDFASKAKATSLKALRALSSRDLYELQNELNLSRFPVVLDGYFLPKSLPEIFTAKQQAQVPLLLGWNSAEIPAGAFLMGKTPTPENFRELVKKAFPESYEQALALYPHANEEQVALSATALGSDRFIAYSTWKWFDLHRKNSQQPVYRYLYSKLRPALVDQNLTAGLAGGTLKKEGNTPAAPKALGAPHACEIEYCMGNLHLIKEYAWTPDDYKVSETMSSYFANFIKTGNPNGENLPQWDAATPDDANPPVMVIDTQSKTERASDEGRYLFLDTFYQK
ncbi:carboxylesterase/lipase family protein [Dyadobacter tibetensis]|uniref:carboxylesterase/lipase family protein n=1 Tax=Dyadobacter tibetensis TaxID=1211851 RepID=UPI000471DC50|nr:carboxylesterase family protein [Dyadobacter tibetensis]